jgi:hypothetical protein
MFMGGVGERINIVCKMWWTLMKAQIKGGVGLL